MKPLTKILSSALALGLVAGGCSLGQPLRWKSTQGRNHELVGAIWSTVTERFVEPDQLAAELARPRFAILGEQHDNVDHHRLQAHLITAIADAGTRPAVAFEMLTTDKSGAIAECLSGPSCSGNALRKAVDWDNGGWSEWRIYRPVFEAALTKGRTIAAVGLPRKTIREIATSPEQSEVAALISALGIEEPPPPAIDEAMAEEIRQAHCGHAPETHIAGMIRAQRARDATMAVGLAEAAAVAGKAVLIAGFGHARFDRGVPAYLNAGEDLLSMAFVEVEDGVTDPRAYASRFGAEEIPFHYLWFTPRGDDEDPCEKFSHQLEAIGD